MVRALWPEAAARWCARAAGTRRRADARLAYCGGERAWGTVKRRRELERQFPGWEIWYVPRGPDGATWRARPRMLIDADDPEDLAAAIRAADNPVVPDWGCWPPAGSRGQGAAAPRAGGVGRGCMAARKGPQKAPGAASGFPAGGSAWRSLSGPGGRRGGPALADIAESPAPPCSGRRIRGGHRGQTAGWPACSGSTSGSSRATSTAAAFLPPRPGPGPSWGDWRDVGAGFQCVIRWGMPEGMISYRHNDGPWLNAAISGASVASSLPHPAGLPACGEDRGPHPGRMRRAGKRHQPAD